MENASPQKLIVVMGPTSSGKSSLAIEIARQWNGEIISADSRQVYRGMDVGTGKVKRDQEMKNSKFKIQNFPFEFPDNSLPTTRYLSEGIPHHLLDVADPNDDYNVSHFAKDARAAIEDIMSRKKLPVLCGGTGFWIQALIDNQNIPNVPPNLELREVLSKKTPEELFEMLQQLDPTRAKTIDRQNPRRLVRAIEIAENQNKELGIKNEAPGTQHSTFDIRHSLILALCPPKPLLDAKIKTRLEVRFEEGMIEEVTRLHEGGVTWERLDAFGLEYRWISRFLRKTISEQEMKEKLFFDSIHYAKRQMTWIRRWQKLGAPIHIIETPEEAMTLAEEFLKKEDCPKTLSGS